jgi:hypothetical protein
VGHPAAPSPVTTKVFRPVPEPLDLENDLLTADALQTVRDNLDWLVTERKATTWRS